MNQTINKTEDQSANIDQLVMFQNALKTLREILNIQCSNGNWNYNPYMHGVANGMIFALAFLDNKEPEYLETPEVWLCDLPNTDKPTAFSKI